MRCGECKRRPAALFHARLCLTCAERKIANKEKEPK